MAEKPVVCLPLAGFLSEVTCVLSSTESPQVHFHILTEPQDLALTGHYKVELCCHGCGESLLVMYTDPLDPRLPTSKGRFVHKHLKCPDFGFDIWCPDVRKNALTLDLRKVHPFRNNSKEDLTGYPRASKHITRAPQDET